MSATDGEVLRVVVADDHPVYREGLTMVLGSLAGVEVVGEAGDAQGDAPGRVPQPGRRADGPLDAWAWRGRGHPRGRRQVPRDAGARALDARGCRQCARRAARRGTGLPRQAPTKQEVALARRGFRRSRCSAAPSPNRSSLRPAAAARPPRRRSREPLPAPHHPPAAGPRSRRGWSSNAAIASRLYLSDKTVANVVSNVLARRGASDRAAAPNPHGTPGRARVGVSLGVGSPDESTQTTGAR